MSIKIGHAVSDEQEKTRGGAAGDPTGGEVLFATWYNKDWENVLRAKDDGVKEKIAAAMEKAVNNNAIGYDQDQRTTLYTQAQKVGFDFSKITAKCECDCSSLVAACIIAAGISVSKDIATGNMVAAIVATGNFDRFTSTDYTRSDKKLRRGDIVQRTGHTFVVLENGSDYVAPAPAPKPQPDKALVEAFVTRLYAASLDRAPDPDGLNAWVNALMNRTLDPWQAARGIVLSDESISQRETTEEWVKELYRALLGREPDSEGEQAWLAGLYTHLSRIAAVNGILGSPEFSGVAATMGF